MKKVCGFIFLLSSSVLAAPNELTLDLGITRIGGGYPEGDSSVGFHGQVGYQLHYNSNVALYTGIAAGNGAITSASIYIVSVGQLSVQPAKYSSIPLAVQFSYPLDNNVFFVRAGTNYYRVDDYVSGAKRGFDIYGAAGWEYYFGEENNWSIGLNYQYIGLKKFNAQVGSLSLGYCF